MHEADLVVLEGAVRLTRAVSRRQPVEAFGLEDAVDGIPVQMRQEWVRMKVRSSSGKPVARRKAQTMARSSSLAFQGSLCGRAERSWQSAGPRLRHLRMVSVETP